MTQTGKSRCEATDPKPLFDLMNDLRAVIDRHTPPPVTRLRPISSSPDDVQRHLKERRLRERFFEPGLFADPAWDMLLDLWIARASGRSVSISSLCIASAVPQTTALRWIERLATGGYVLRTADPRDARRRHVSLSPHGSSSLSHYFCAVARATA